MLQASDFSDICDWPTLGDPPQEVSFLSLLLSIFNTFVLNLSLNWNCLLRPSFFVCPVTVPKMFRLHMTHYRSLRDENNELYTVQTKIYTVQYRTLLYCVNFRLFLNLHKLHLGLFFDNIVTFQQHILISWSTVSFIIIWILDRASVNSKDRGWQKGTYGVLKCFGSFASS